MAKKSGLREKEERESGKKKKQGGEKKEESRHCRSSAIPLKDLLNLP
jgi:hypothetical protein